MHVPSGFGACGDPRCCWMVKPKDLVALIYPSKRYIEIICVGNPSVLSNVFGLNELLGSCLSSLRNNQYKQSTWCGWCMTLAVCLPVVLGMSGCLHWVMQPPGVNLGSQTQLTCWDEGVLRTMYHKGMSAGSFTLLKFGLIVNLTCLVVLQVRFLASGHFSNVWPRNTCLDHTLTAFTCWLGNPACSVSSCIGIFGLGQCL